MGRFLLLVIIPDEEKSRKIFEMFDMSRLFDKMLVGVIEAEQELILYRTEADILCYPLAVSSQV